MALDDDDYIIVASKGLKTDQGLIVLNPVHVHTKRDSLCLRKHAV